MLKNIASKIGCTLAYTDYGDRNGYAILVQHGLIASIDDYLLFHNLLKRKIRLICIARPGYGRSAPHLMENFAEWSALVAPLIDELGLTQFDILGISSGAPYAYSLASGFPDQVRNVFVLSGIPALYDESVLAHWPYPKSKNQNMEELKALAYDLFFSGLSYADLKTKAIKDSMMHECFGVAQDLRLRFRDWGFCLSDIRQNVFMRHSKADEAVPFQTAVHTAELSPHCQLELTETDPHFSPDVLDSFICNTMMKHIRA